MLVIIRITLNQRTNKTIRNIHQRRRNRQIFLGMTSRSLGIIGLPNYYYELQNKFCLK